MGCALNRTWAGVGIKGGGFLFVLGADTFEGTAFRLDHMPQHSLTEINITSIRGGLGLGGGAGVSLFFAFNVHGPLVSINGKMPDWDWGINLSIPGAKIGVGKFSYQILKKLTTGADLLKHFDTKRLADFRELASLFYSSMYDVGGGLNVGETKAVVIDVPDAGWAAEISAYSSWGDITVGDCIVH
ncbi:hypothetical protein PQR75_46935 [Paraburkholderia fungorum]|uniref:hypothetical protein n=1 Tax=Paraburkholderia fungorum TaxID=134537 RepID=UPI0038B9E666